MVAELWTNLVGDYEQRTTGMSPGGKLACFECLRTTRFVENAQFRRQGKEAYKWDPRETMNWRGNNFKGGEVRKDGQINEKEENIVQMFDLRRLKWRSSKYGVFYGPNGGF